ncbi:TetR/AcrR family transcriptional regulator [Saccharothrix syringae]|uniref:TetR family transcriptional regulator n=1 Tax=Saccharothrix syringae TaxID=103733 RepID=A0A5Q0GZH6_SACSY|nr:TetR family transcriptional regulator [Saccharothrix syringae]QFZ19421.1 TetR family transcriptional regulator [Saccharothrix syringae]
MGGLREHKKSATRMALHEAALRLALELGPDRVTVESIADAASVSRRTFSNYFANKEEAIFYGDLVRLRRLLELVRAQPDGPPRAALVGAAAALVDEVLDPRWLTRRREVARHTGLAAHVVTAYAAVERDLVAEITRRQEVGDPLRARVLAATFLAALRAATQHWLEHPDVPLAEVVAEALGRPEQDAQP